MLLEKTSEKKMREAQREVWQCACAQRGCSTREERKTAYLKLYNAVDHLMAQQSHDRYVTRMNAEERNG